MEPFAKVKSPFDLTLVGVEEICAILRCIEKDLISAVDPNDCLSPTHRDVIEEFIGQLKPDFFERVQMGDHVSEYTKACVQLPSLPLASFSKHTKSCEIVLNFIGFLGPRFNHDILVVCSEAGR